MSENEQLPAGEEGEPAGADSRPDAKVIKRYTNRKLYDTVESRYVTLDEIAQMIKGGAEVKIIDNRTKEDLTSVTLAQIIFEEEKKRSQMPLGVLREIIRHGGEAVAGFYQDKVQKNLTDRLGEMKVRTESLRDELESRVRGVIPSILRREEKVEAAADGAHENGAPKEPAEKQGPLQDVLAAGQRAVEGFQQKVDQSVQKAVGAMSASSLSAEFEKLQKKLEALEKRLEQLGK